MRLLLMPIIVAVASSCAPAFAQTSPPAAAPPAASPSIAPPASAPVVPAGKRAACRQDAGAKGLRGQEQRDAMQLCVAQAQLDCLRDAIAQKVIGPQRRDFMKTCMGTMPRGRGGAPD